MAKTEAYCRKCSYPLAGLLSDRCPECGRHFDLKCPSTFNRRPTDRWRRPLLRILCALSVGAAVAGAWRGYGQWRLSHIRATCRAVEGDGGQVLNADGEPYGGTGRPVVELHGSSVYFLDGEEVDGLARELRWLPPFSLQLGERCAQGDAMAHFNGLTNLKALTATGLTD